MPSDATSRQRAPDRGDGIASAPAAGRPSAGEIWRRLGPTRWVGLLWATAPALMGFALLASFGPVSDWFGSWGASGIYVYAIIFAAAAGSGMLPTYAQSLLGGWVFGFWYGWAGAMFGFTAAAVIGYFIAQRASHHRVERLVESDDRARAVRDALVGRGWLRTLGIVALIRVPPNSPFALTNLAMATTGVRLAPYTVGTCIGMAPRTAVAVWFGAMAQASGARDIQEYIHEKAGWWYALGSFALMFAMLAIIGAIANHALKHVTGQRSGCGIENEPDRPAGLE